MTGWWERRIQWLNAELNNVEILPKNKTFTAQVGYSEIAPHVFTLVAYRDMTDLSATLKNAALSDFEISAELSKTPTGNGGYLATIGIKPKNSLSAGTYTDSLVLSGSNQGKTFEITVPLSFAVRADSGVSVLTPDRAVPQVKPPEEATVIAPVVVLSGEFTAGPNPISKQSGIVNSVRGGGNLQPAVDLQPAVNFFRQGKRINNCELRIYDATGNVINKVKIRDKALNTQARRKVGSWDLTDRKGRLVSAGTYLVKGVIKTSDGKSEKVSVILGVR